MNRPSFYSTLIFSTSLLLLGFLLIFPIISHEAVPNDGQINYKPVMNYSTNIQCKKVIIDPYSNNVTQPGVKGGTTPSCPLGMVPVGINNGRLNAFNGTTEIWLSDTNPDSWGATVTYTQGTISYNKGTDALNAVSLICAPRYVVFQSGPCTQ